VLYSRGVPDDGRRIARVTSHRVSGGSLSVKRRLPYVVLVITVALAAVLPLRRAHRGWSAEAAGAVEGEPGPPPNVVIIVMDTARGDRLSCYGYARETSPRLEELARSATIYANAHSTSSWTAPGHASLFTGLFPAAHGATQEDWRLDEGLTTLAEVLSAYGYRTVGIVENPMLSRDLGYAQGFSEYHEVWLPRTRPGPRSLALDRFVETVGGAAPGQPFFIFVNLIEPHSPYDSSRQFKDRFVTDQSITLDANEWRDYYVGRRTFTGAEITHLNELYDAELLFTDYVVGKMADALGDAGLLDRTAFIVTSDHGENIGDHGHMDHVFSLYESTTRIPLLVRYPPRFPPGSTAENPVQLTDIFPTVLDLAGIGAAAYPSQGRSLLGEIPRDREVLCEYYYPRQAINGYRSLTDRRSPRLAPYRRRIKSLTSGDMKLIHGSDGRDELYDLRRDPGELTNIIDSPEEAATVRGLEARLSELVERWGSQRSAGEPEAGAPDAKLDEATKEALRSLGYLE
jgi:arylsulfatase A-like enzyme